MGRLIEVVLSTSHQWMVRAGLFLGLFVLLACGGAGLGLQQVQASLDSAVAAEMQRNRVTVQAVNAVFEALQRSVTAPACSAEFLQQLRLVAMLPDGINEMIYMPEGVPLCSANFASFSAKTRLGPPDIRGDEGGGTDVWLFQAFDELGYRGVFGTLVRRGAFAVLIPASASKPQLEWAEQAVGVKMASGAFRRIDGSIAPWPIAEDGKPAQVYGEWLPRMWSMQCAALSTLCVAQVTSLATALQHFAAWAGLGLVFVALAAAWLSGVAHGLVRRFFAFEARFLRHFTADRIICTYQPVLDMATGRVSGCEVLVRWRDLDDRVVFPDQFLPVIERRGLTLKLTEFVIDRAHDELTAHMPAHRALQVNFNVSPRDLDADLLLPLLSRFDLEGGQFRVVVEIVETEAFDFDKASRDIDLLRRAGIGCYIDDFGRGFSSIHSLAALAVDGVKLDRSFAMASDASVLGQMLPQTLTMIRQAGRKAVVEGVETEDRMQMLRAVGLVDFVQGYLISRPVPIQRFIQVMQEHDAAPRKALVPAHASATVVALRR